MPGLSTASTNGFLTKNEVETAAENNEGNPTEDRLQYLFPSINFTESLSITAWSFVATRCNSTNESLPQLQVWRPESPNSGGNLHNQGSGRPESANFFDRVATVGNSSILQGSGPLYRYVLQTPILVSPGDVLGIYIPPSSALSLRFRDVGSTDTYFYGGEVFFRNVILTSQYVTESRFIPLVAVQFSK